MDYGDVDADAPENDDHLHTTEAAEEGRKQQQELLDGSAAAHTSACSSSSSEPKDGIIFPAKLHELLSQAEILGWASVRTLLCCSVTPTCSIGPNQIGGF